MDDTANRTRLRLMQVLAVAGVFGAIFLSRTMRAWQPDVFTHLVLGRAIWETGVIPRDEFICHPSLGHPFIDFSWFAQWLMYGGWRAGGFELLCLARSLLATISFFILWRTLRRFRVPRAPALALVFGASLIIIGTSEIRPYLASFLFFPACLHLALGRLEGRKLPLWPIPLMMVAWVNMHGAWVAWFLSAAALVAGESAAEWRRLRRGGTVTPRAFVDALCSSASVPPLLAVAAASFAATFVNPYGWRIWQVPLLLSGTEVFREYVPEWTAPQGLQFLPLFLYLAAVLAVMGLAWRRLRPAHALLGLLWVAMAVNARRHIPLMAFATVPLAGRYGILLWREWRPRVPAAWRGIVAGGLAAMMPVAGIAQFLALDKKMGERYASAWGIGIAAHIVPVGAADFIMRHRPAGEIYNEFHLGGYLIWRLYPDYRVYQDARVEAGGPQLFAEFVSVSQTRPGWEDTLRRRHVETLVLARTPLLKGSRINQAVAKSPEWILIHRDRLCLVYVRAGGPNAALVRRLEAARALPAAVNSLRPPG